METKQLITDASPYSAAVYGILVFFLATATIVLWRTLWKEMRQKLTETDAILKECTQAILQSSMINRQTQEILVSLDKDIKAQIEEVAARQLEYYERKINEKRNG